MSDAIAIKQLMTELEKNKCEGADFNTGINAEVTALEALRSPLLNSLSVVVGHLLRLAAENDEFREQVRRFAQDALDATATLQRGMTAAANAEIAIATITDTLGPIPPDDGVAVESPLPALTLGQKSPASEPSIVFPQRWAAKVEDDLALIEARCELKAKAARWAATRARLMAEGAVFPTEIAPGDREIIEEAKKLPNCFLWMCRPNAPTPRDPQLWENIAGCFGAVAGVLGILKQLQYEPGANQPDFEQALDLLAEAQSALRVGILSLDGPNDHDQLQAYNWLKSIANDNQIYIRHFMRTDDPADPSGWSGLLDRIEALDSRLQEGIKRSKARKKLMGKLRHKLSLAAKDEPNASDHWNAIVAIVEELLEDGLPPNNRELRDLLAPTIDDMPDLPDIPPGFDKVLREIDHFLAVCPPPDTAPVQRYSEDVQKVADLLAGRTVVLIGGNCRPAAYKSLKEAFGLAALHWVETKDHESIDNFKHYVDRPDVAVVLLAIRWSSHQYTDIRTFCNRYAKPLTRLPGGYNPNQVAAQILAQCSNRLML